MSNAAISNPRPILLLACAAFASAASLRVCDPLLPQLALDFQASTERAAQVVSAFAVAYGVLQIFYGPLGDRYGKYRVIAAATLACAVGNIGAALAPSLGWLIGFRVLAGATAAGIVPLSMAWIGDTVPYERRQATLARFLSGTILGLINGQVIGGFCADTLGWRWSFALLAGVFVMVGSLLHAEFRRNPTIRGGAHSSSAPAAQPSFAAQILSVLRIRWARTVLVIVGLEGMMVFGALAFIPSYLHAHFGVSLTGAGAIVALYGLGGLSYTLIARRLIALLGEHGLAASGGILLGAAFVLLALGGAWFWSLPASFVAGLGFYMLHNTLQTNATQMAPATRGTAVALFAAALFLGQSAGVAMAAAILHRAGAPWLFVATALILPIIGFGFAQAVRYRPASVSVSA